MSSAKYAATCFFCSCIFIACNTLPAWPCKFCCWLWPIPRLTWHSSLKTNSNCLRFFVFLSLSDYLYILTLFSIWLSVPMRRSWPTLAYSVILLYILQLPLFARWLLIENKFAWLNFLACCGGPRESVKKKRTKFSHRAWSMWVASWELGIERPVNGCRGYG